MTPEQLKLADKIEAWSPEKWKPLTLIAHERRLAVAALRTPDARVKELAAARENLGEAWSALAMIRETVETLGPVGAMKASEHLDGPTFMHEAEAIVAGIRAALSHQPGTGEADGSLQGMIRAVYGECDAEDCAFVDREWAKLRGYILPTDGTSTIAKSPALDTATVERSRCIAICEGWIDAFQDREIKFTSAREYAIDAIDDIIDLIRDGHQPSALAAKEGV